MWFFYFTVLKWFKLFTLFETYLVFGGSFSPFPRLFWKYFVWISAFDGHIFGFEGHYSVFECHIISGYIDQESQLCLIIPTSDALFDFFWSHLTIASKFIFSVLSFRHIHKRDNIPTIYIYIYITTKCCCRGYEQHTHSSYLCVVHIFICFVVLIIQPFWNYISQDLLKRFSWYFNHNFFMLCSKLSICGVHCLNISRLHISIPKKSKFWYFCLLFFYLPHVIPFLVICYFILTLQTSLDTISLQI